MSIPANNYPVYDFVAASRVERPLSAALKVWTAKFAKLFCERWLELAPTEIQITTLPFDALTFVELQNRWSEPALGIPLTIKSGAVNGLIVCTRRDILLMLMDVLSETLTEKPADRELTSIEIALYQLLLEQWMFTFGEAWPDKEVMPTSLGELDDHPQRSRQFAPGREMLVCSFQVATACAAETGPARVSMVFAKDELKSLLGVAAKPTEPVSNSQKIPFENLSQIAVSITARLGAAELNMEELLQLDPGDIIKLNQSIEAPLVLEINSHPAYVAWPGRRGEKQCFQIESLI